MPWLQTRIKEGNKLRKQYPDIITKTKQLFVHKIATFVLTQTQPLIIYAFTTLTIVAYYGNYMVVILGLVTLNNSIFNGIGASIGNLVSEGNKEKILDVFQELYSIRFIFTSVLVLTAYYITPQFIEIWIGNGSLLDDSVLILILISAFITITRQTVDGYIQAYGLFNDMWAPATEAALNIVMSISLGYLWGINGVLSGSIISLVIIVLGWKPYFLFRQGLKERLFTYVKIFVIHHTLLGLVILCFTMLGIDFSFNLTQNRYIDLVLNVCISALSIIVILTLLLAITTRGTKIFINRLVTQLKIKY